MFFVLIYLALGLLFQVAFYGAGSFSDIYTWIHIFFWFWILLFWIGFWVIIFGAVVLLGWFVVRYWYVVFGRKV